MADEKIELPEGWAILRDPKRVTERQRRPVTRLQARVAGSDIGALLQLKGSLSDAEFEAEALKALGSEAFGLIDELNDAMIVALVERMQIDGQPEVTGLTADGLLDLPGPVYDALKNATARYVTEITPNFGPTPEDPTPPSAD